MDDFYKATQVESSKMESPLNIGKITERDKLIVAKQILIGLAVLYVITLVALVLIPSQAEGILDICKTVLPTLATLIIAQYFKGSYF